MSDGTGATPSLPAPWAVNEDPLEGGEESPPEHRCELFYWTLQDANYNVLGVVDEVGTLVERYEYTPYGERQVYRSAGSNDPRCHARTIESRRCEDEFGTAPYSLCDFGHQGLLFEKESGLLYNRARYYHPRLMRMISTDPKGYVDGMNLYQGWRSNPVNGLDPEGMATIADYVAEYQAVEERKLREYGFGPNAMEQADTLLRMLVRMGAAARADLLGHAHQQDAIRGKIQAIMSRANFLGVDPLGLDDESQEWEDSTVPYRVYLGKGVGQGVGNGVADTAYQLVTLGFANGNWLPFGGEDNPGQAWGYATGRIVGEIGTVAIPAKYLGYGGKAARLVNLAVKGLTLADKIQNVVILSKMAYQVAEDVYEGKVSSDTAFKAVLIGTTLYVIHKASFAGDVGNGGFRVGRYVDMPTPRLGQQAHHGAMSAWVRASSPLN